MSYMTFCEMSHVAKTATSWYWMICFPLFIYRMWVYWKGGYTNLKRSEIAHGCLANMIHVPDTVHHEGWQEKNRLDAGGMLVWIGQIQHYKAIHNVFKNLPKPNEILFLDISVGILLMQFSFTILAPLMWLEKWECIQVYLLSTTQGIRGLASHMS